MRLTEEQRLLQETARRFAQNELAPHAAKWDRDARFPMEAMAELGRLGFMGMVVPPEHGGAGADHVGYALALEEIAAGDGATSTIVAVNSLCCMAVLGYGSEDQKRRFLKPMAAGDMLAAFCLTEPQAGSDAAAIKTRARRHGNRWVLNGTKQFITSGSTARVALVFAVTEPEAGRRGISAFIVPTDTSGYRVARLEHKLGQRASDTAQLSFEDMELTPDLLLGQEGEGYRIALANLEGGRIGIAAQAVGMARAAYDAALAYAKERESFGRKSSSTRRWRSGWRTWRHSWPRRAGSCWRRRSGATPASRRCRRRRWRNCLPPKWPSGSPPTRSRSMAATATSPMSRSSASGATCGSARSTKAPATSSGC
jgi:butyryl-CoA dehydrogenase